MDKSIRKILETPFEKALIKQRQGNGRTLDYIEADVIIKKLNEIFDSRWDFEIVTPPAQAVINGHAVVQVRTTVPNMIEKDGKLVQDGWITKDAYGGKKITMARSDGSMLDLASDLKAASIDGLKKSVTLIGIALDLYGADKDEEVAAEPTKVVNNVVVNVGTENKPASAQQLKAIDTMLKAKKVTDVVKFAKDNLKIDVKVGELKESEAKDIIQSLNSFVG